MTLPVIEFDLLDDVSSGEILDRTTSDVTPGIDWALDNDGDLIVPMRFTTGIEAVAQGIRIRVQIVKGEYFANLDRGVDYYEEILGQKFNEVQIRNEFRTAILDAPGVVDILELTAAFNRSTRELTVSWTVLTELSTEPLIDSLVI